MTYRRLLFASLIAVPAIASAQTLPARVVRRAATYEISDGEPVSFFIERSRELELTNPQRDSLIALRRRVRQQNTPFLRSLDSLRREVGIDLEPRARTDDKERDRMERFQKMSAPYADSMRVNNDAARDEAWAMLEPMQRSRVDSMLKADRAARGRERDGQPPRRPPG